MTDEELIELTPKRYKAEVIQKLKASTHLYVFCDICQQPFSANAGFDDGKPRTPRYKGFIVCLECDPRHREDRYKKEGYRILHRGRLRVIQMAQVCQALSKRPCKNAPPQTILPKCKCPECVAGKLFPPF